MTAASCPSCEAPVQRVPTRIHRELVLEPDPHLDGTIDVQTDGFAIRLASAGVARARTAGTALYREHVCGRGR